VLHEQQHGQAGALRPQGDHQLAAVGRLRPAHPGLAGDRLHQPGERCFRVPASQGHPENARVGQFRLRAAVQHHGLSLLGLLLHGQRDQLPAQAVPHRGEPVRLLGEDVRSDGQPEREHAQDQQRPALFHRAFL